MDLDSGVGQIVGGASLAMQGPDHGADNEKKCGQQDEGLLKTPYRVRSPLTSTELALLY